MKASDYIALYLEKRNVTHVFELVGGMIATLLDSLQQQTSIKIISMHHEQGAGFAAEGYGRIRGVPGVAMATSGPGATNLLTAIGSCYFDSTPTVFITGQVNRHEQKGDRPIRQLGFQETDIISMAHPVTKAAWSVMNPADLPKMLEDAFDLALSGRPGPVLLDVPMDVQREEITDLSRLSSPVPVSSHEIPEAAMAFCAAFYRDIAKAERPLILVGGGMRSALAVESFRFFASALGVPVVHSLMGVDVLPANHAQRVGMIGSYGNRWANTAMSESDFVLVLGSRLDVRQTGASTENFKADRVFYHVDCEVGELNNRVKGCETLASELTPFLQVAMKMMLAAQDRSQWISRVMELKRQWPDTKELVNQEGINPNEFMHQLSAVSKEAVAYVADVGQHQMWAAQSLDLHSGQRFLTSGGMGSMGFALPAAIGACLGNETRPVVVIAGDGGFQCNIQELQTVVRNRLPLKLVVINNGCLGMVRQFQESYFKARYQSTLWGYDAPSFTKVAAAYGIGGQFIEDPKDLPGALQGLWTDPKAPFLLEVGIHALANTYPKMAFGRLISEMEPDVKSIEIEGT